MHPGPGVKTPGYRYVAFSSLSGLCGRRAWGRVGVSFTTNKSTQYTLTQLTNKILKMEKKRKTKWWWTIAVPCFVFSVFFTCCKDTSEIKNVPYNPSAPITIDHFKPDTGRVATQMLIFGDNFGSDKSKINVLINNKKATVIGVNGEGTVLYCIVPSLKEAGRYREDGEKITAEVKVRIDEQEAVADRQLPYTFSMNVSTFLGFTDQDGKSDVIDGSFEKAQLGTPSWLTFDEPTPQGVPRNFYLIEESTNDGYTNGSVRFINMQERKVETLFKAGDNVNRPRTVAFTLDYDTMIIANDDGSWSSIGTIMFVRNPTTRRFSNGREVVMRHKQCNGGAVHPITGEYWFNSYEKSQVYKVKDRSQIPWVYGGRNGNNKDGEEGTNSYFLVQDDGWEFSIQIAPSGDFAYAVVRNKHYVARINFNHSTGNFEGPPTPFVGFQDKAGFADGVGSGALFRNPQQGAFDEHDNFYMCDAGNHCIRKITPTGVVSIYAGRPENAGYSDGAPRDAQFDFPLGIAFDDINQTFYVADRNNSRIRTITVE
jgi:hypothetical protein